MEERASADRVMLVSERPLLSPLVEVDRINDAYSWYFWKFPISTGLERCRGQGTKIQVRRCESKHSSRGSEAMSSHILLATVTGIALSTPAWAHDPAEAPIDTDLKSIFLDPAESIEAILLEPAEAPIDTEMKILSARQYRGAFAGEHRSRAIRLGRPSRCTYRLHSRGTPAGTDDRGPCRGLGRCAASRRSSLLGLRPASRVPVVTARSMWRS